MDVRAFVGVSYCKHPMNHYIWIMRDFVVSNIHTDGLVLLVIGMGMKLGHVVHAYLVWK